MIIKYSIRFYKDTEVRAIWDETNSKWRFSVIDIVGVLSGSKNPQVYRRKLKQRLKAEGNESVTNCHDLKIKSPR